MICKQRSGKYREMNEVELLGKIVSTAEYSHVTCEENFYLVYMKVLRLSSMADYVPVIISEYMLNQMGEYRNRTVRVWGQYRSYNLHRGGRSRLILSVFVQELVYVTEEENQEGINQIIISGNVCRKPVFRITPFGREITDLMIAVNRPYGKVDYIPCICWGRNARFAQRLMPGEHLKLDGRIQSREYLKKTKENQMERYMAYEVSVTTLERTELPEGRRNRNQDKNLSE